MEVKCLTRINQWFLSIARYPLSQSLLKVSSYYKNKDLKMGLKVRMINCKSRGLAYKHAGTKTELKPYRSQRKSLNLLIFMTIKILEDCCMQTMKRPYKTVTTKQDPLLFKDLNKLPLRS